MATQSEYELETQLVNQLVGMHYELVNVTDETSMKANLRKQIEIHNRLEAAHSLTANLTVFFCI
jgi:type I restriction enzyme R subunit